MVKFLTAALGGLTALAVAGLATPSGQAMFGTQQAPLAIPLSVISDPGPVSLNNVTAPAATPMRTVPGVAAAAAIVSKRHVSAPVAHLARPAQRPTARRIYRSTGSAPVAVAHSVPTPAGLPIGGAGGIGSIIQFLPAMLQQAAPAPSPYGYGYGPAPVPQAPPVPSPYGYGPAPAPQAAPAPGWHQGNQGDGPER